MTTAAATAALDEGSDAVARRRALVIRHLALADGEAVADKISVRDLRESRVSE